MCENCIRHLHNLLLSVAAPLDCALRGTQYATSDGDMLYFVCAYILSFLLDRVATARLSDPEQELELLLLR